MERGGLLMVPLLLAGALTFHSAQAEGPLHPELPTADQFLHQDPKRPEEEKGFFAEVGDTLWDLGKTFVFDMGYLATAPLRPTKEGFFTFVGGVALIGVTMGVLDDPIRGFAQRNRHENLDQTL